MFVSTLFYIFSALLLLGAFGVVFLRCSVHAVLALIFTFLNGSALYVLLGAEFVALSTVIVYVGAVSVLLMFVVMTVDDAERKKWVGYKFFALLLGVFLMIELILLTKAKERVIFCNMGTNIVEVESLLYIKYGLVFQACAVLLLVGMVSAVIVTFQSRSKKIVKRQNPRDQIARDPNEVLTLVKVKQGEGLQ